MASKENSIPKFEIVCFRTMKTNLILQENGKMNTAHKLEFWPKR